MFILQEGRYGQDWEDVEIGESEFDTLEEALEAAQMQETHGKYHFRVLDSEENEVARFHIAYESVLINTHVPGWLDDIRRDYGIDKSVFAHEVMRWIANFMENE